MVAKSPPILRQKFFASSHVLLVGKYLKRASFCKYHPSGKTKRGKNGLDILVETMKLFSSINWNVFHLLALWKYEPLPQRCTSIWNIAHWYFLSKKDNNFGPLGIKTQPACLDRWKGGPSGLPRSRIHSITRRVGRYFGIRLIGSSACRSVIPSDHLHDWSVSQSVS